MNILISAYNCSPYMGSEEKLSWSIVSNYAKKGISTHVITNSIYKEDIERYMDKTSDLYVGYLKFVYIDIPNVFKKIKGYLGQCIRYTYFQRKIKTVSKIISNDVKIDFCQHISWASIIQPIGLIKTNIPLVVGPVGGGECTPKELLVSFSKKNQIKELVRVIVTKLLYIKPDFWRLCKRADVIFTTTNETANIIPKRYSNKIIIQQGISVNANEICMYKTSQNAKKFRIIMAGRFLYWKAFDLGIKACVMALQAGGGY